ncbi:MAG: tetratricopeptide repeat protein, partial [Rubrivivax sp.]|nr:tetratricopeptide repeat protein [Pyrinomonadaceae bacterium]
AALLIRVGRDDKAADHLEAARRLQPGSANVLRQLAELYERNGNKSKAEEARQALGVEDAKQPLVASAGGVLPRRDCRGRGLSAARDGKRQLTGMDRIGRIENIKTNSGFEI